MFVAWGDYVVCSFTLVGVDAVVLTHNPCEFPALSFVEPLSPNPLIGMIGELRPVIMEQHLDVDGAGMLTYCPLGHSQRKRMLKAHDHSACHESRKRSSAGDRNGN